MDEIDDGTHKKITALSKKGDAFADKGKYSEALAKYWEAFDLIPEPKTKWDGATWLLAAIGDANFLGKDFQAGVDNLTNSMHCPGAIGNPFLHLRLGQCQFEVGNLDRAADNLTRAFALEGDKIFDEEDSKYLEFLKTRIETEKPKKKSWWKK